MIPAKLQNSWERRQRFAEVKRLRKIELNSRSIRQDHSAICQNCGVHLTGPFCHACGQRDKEFRRPIWSMVAELLDEVFAADSRLFKTLFMLVLIPGGLTANFMSGMRARYLPPIRLYIATSIIFFLLITIANMAIIDIKLTLKDDFGSNAQTSNTQTSNTQTNSNQTNSNQAKAEESDGTPALQSGQSGQSGTPAPAPTLVPDAGDKVTAPPSVPKDVAASDGDETAADALNELMTATSAFDEADKAEMLKEFDHLSPEKKAQLEKALTRAEKISKRGQVALNSDGEQMSKNNFPYDVEINMFTPLTSEQRQGLRQEELDRIQQSKVEPVKIGNWALDVKQSGLGFDRALRSPENMNELLNDWVPLALIVTMPLFAIILRLFHWRKDQCLMNQLVFSLHFHSFLFVLMSSLIVMVPVFGDALAFEIVSIVAPLYMLVSLKVGQRQGWIRSFFKFVIIAPFYIVLQNAIIMLFILKGLEELAT